MAIEWLNAVFTGLPFMATWLLAVISIVVGSIVFSKWGNVRAAVSFGLLFFIVLGALFMSYGWMGGAPVIVALVLLAVAQIIL